MPADWVPDVLGEGFEQLTLELPGDAIATLVRYTARTGWRSGGGVADGADVLYLHGWSDYFFQRPLAAFWHEAGARFYALDLRNYGRSLRPGLSPGLVTDLGTYDADIAAALAAMGRTEETTRPLILVGHSTGGLTLSLWAERHPGIASTLILNSPWLEFQAAEIGRLAIAPLISLSARRNPLAPLPPIDPGNYTRVVSAEFGGEWTYNRLWRPDRGFPVTSAFLNAVLQGHSRVAAGLSIEAPVLVLLSDKSHLQPKWTDDATRTDVAINVDIVAERALSLGDTVTVARIPGALHDVFLSPQSIRDKAYDQLGRWLGGYYPDDQRGGWVERLFGR